MLAGILITLWILRNVEQEITTDYQRRSDLFAHHFIASVESQTGSIGLEARARALAAEFAIPLVHLTGTKGALHIGTATPGAWVEKRTAVAHRARGDDSYEIAFHYPSLAQAVQLKRKTIIAGMSAGFFAFGLFLTWLLRYLLTGPFDNMIQAARAISAGDTARRFAINRRDEFGYLAQFINEVMDKLMQQREALKSALFAAQTSEAEVYRQKEKLQVTLNAIADAVVATDAAGIVGYINPSAERLTGWSRKQALGMPLAEVLNIVIAPAREAQSDVASRCLKTGKTVEGLDDAVLIRRDGQEVAVGHSASPILAASGDVTGCVVIFRDVSEARQLSQQLTFAATHDHLTRLYNRREFECQLRTALEEAHKGIRPSALCFIDLDHFKLINDTCGHTAGDELLRQIAAALRAHVRASDSVARLGGDEFAVLLKGCSLSKGREIAEALLKAINASRFVWQQQRFDIGASIGVVALSAEQADEKDALAAADLAAYMAKDAGRNCVRAYGGDDRTIQERLGEMHWVARIQDALKEDRFQLYMQPVIALHATAPGQFGREILLRLIDERGAIVLPGVFLPAAERYNLMPQIDHWVINRVFTYLAATPQDSCCYTINLSGQTLSSDLLDFIIERSETNNIEPARICFEITESVAIARLDNVKRLITALKRRGFRFALDDFGRGFSSFTYLEELAVDFIKIDGSFVQSMDTIPARRATVEAINQIGHAMNLKTVAEFVETAAVLATLREIGVDYAQGFGIAKPEPLYERVPTLKQRQA